MYKKILFPIDNSENSKRALAYVVDTAIRYNAEVIVVHAYELVEEVAIILYEDPIFHKMEEKLLEKSKNIVAPFVKALDDKGITVSTLLVKGDVEYEIVKISEAQDCDLIIIGSRSKRSLKSYLLGSISNYVIHHSKCPVLIVH